MGPQQEGGFVATVLIAVPAMLLLAGYCVVSWRSRAPAPRFHYLLMPLLTPCPCCCCAALHGLMRSPVPTPKSKTSPNLKQHLMCSIRQCRPRLQACTLGSYSLAVEQVNLARLLLNLIVAPLDLQLILLHYCCLISQLIVQEGQGLCQPGVVCLSVEHIHLQGGVGGAGERSGQGGEARGQKSEEKGRGSARF